MKKIIGVVGVLILVAIAYYAYSPAPKEVVVEKPDVPIAVVTDPLTGVYTNSVYGYTVRYPTGYTVDAKYKYQAMGPGKDILGTKFTIPASMATGTNLSRDTYISIENIKTGKTCLAETFLDNVAATSTIVDNGVIYFVVLNSGAGAGNRYEETVYARQTAKACIGIRYFVHYSVFENYPAGSVKEFDRQALLNEFYSIRKSVVLK